MISSLPAKIIEVEPEAVYQGTIYDQTVVGRLCTGNRITLFDLTTPIVSEDMIGCKIDLHVGLSLDVNDIAVVTRARGVSRPPEPTTKWSYDYVGELTGINCHNRSITLDIEHGSVTVSGYACDIVEWIDENEIAMGSYLSVPDCRSDIIEYTDSRS